MFLDWAVRAACLQSVIMAWCTWFLRGSDKVSTFSLTVNSNSQNLISEAQMREVAELFQIKNHFWFLNCKYMRK